MRIRNLHIIVMLIAGIIVGIFSLINGYDLITLIITMLVVLIVFFTLGLIIQSLLNRIYRQIDTIDKAKQLKEMEEEYNRIQAIENSKENEEIDEEG